MRCYETSIDEFARYSKTPLKVVMGGAIVYFIFVDIEFCNLKAKYVTYFCTPFCVNDINTRCLFFSHNEYIFDMHSIPF